MNDPAYEEIKTGNIVIGSVITWTLKPGDTPQWAQAFGSKRSAVAYSEGPFQVDLEGSNDKQNASVLHSGFGVKASLQTPNSFLEINETSRYIRPNIISADKELTISIAVLS